MARYRSKDDVDLVWNRIRRTITKTLDMAIADRREEVLNELLSGAWTEYTEAISRGEVRELEAKYKPFISTVVADFIVPKELPVANAPED